MSAQTQLAAISRRQVLTATAAASLASLPISGALAEATQFPGVGHRYLVDFQQWKVQLFFESETKLTYTGIKPDGSPGGSETVTIKIEPVRDQLFLVTWQEADMTTVVHLEDFKENTIVTHITEPTAQKGLQFSIYHGKMTLIS